MTSPIHTAHDPEKKKKKKVYTPTFFFLHHHRTGRLIFPFADSVWAFGYWIKKKRLFFFFLDDRYTTQQQGKLYFFFTLTRPILYYVRSTCFSSLASPLIFINIAGRVMEEMAYLEFCLCILIGQRES
jgi:hypothetical protein